MMKKLNVIYFSAAGTTERVAKCVAKGTAIEDVKFYPLKDKQTKSIEIGSDELTIFASPVFEERVPGFVAERLKQFKGNNTPCALVAVFGSRGVGNALAELSNIVENQGFTPMSAGEFVAQHSLFPRFAAARPSEDELSLAGELGAKSVGLTAKLTNIPGKVPSGAAPRFPLTPKTISGKCVKCDICVRECPVAAIKSPSMETDKNTCVKCARCLAVCPNNARQFTGRFFKFIEWMVMKIYGSPKISKLHLN